MTADPRDGFLSPTGPVGDLGAFDRTLEELESSAFAWDDAEAKRRYARWQSEDPLPAVAPSLLNAADIARYVALTGMIYPFHLNRRDLKLATYHFKLLGQVVWWDGLGKEHHVVIEEGDPFKLQADSIAFVTLEPSLRLPDYIALRFNLRVDNVYKGLLLGTGPIVDPGYVGKLSVPLHNLTTNDYVFRGGDHLIAVEFTKVSPNPVWDTSPLAQAGVEALNEGPDFRPTAEHDRDLRFLYLPYKPERKPRSPNQRDVTHHIQEASPNRPVRSSIPRAIQEARRSAKRAERQARIITLAAFVGALALLFSFTEVINSYNDALDAVKQELSEVRAELVKARGNPENSAGRPDTQGATNE